MASEKVQTLTDTNFEQSVIKSAQPVVVDFWAEWCGPCRRLAPTIDELATDYDGQVVVGKLNVDENPATQSRFSIMGIPTRADLQGRRDRRADRRPCRQDRAQEADRQARLRNSEC